MSEFINAFILAVRQHYPRRAVRFVMVTVQLFTIILLAAPILVVVAASSNEAASYVEGAFLPVVTTATFEKIVEDDSGSLVWGKAIKLRRCKFLRVEWTSTDQDGTSFSVPVTIKKEVRVRYGEFSFGPWWVALPPGALEEGTYVDVVHQCHFGWPTRTFFWASPS